MADRMVHFNGVDADRGGHFRAPMTMEAVRDRIRAQQRRDGGRPRALVDWIDPDDLSQTGWGVILHENEDPQILKLLTPLLTYRGQQAGGVRSFVFTEADRALGEAAIDGFFERYGTPPGDVDPTEEQLPYYLLIVGSPEKIPFSFQAELDITHATGRLWFDDPSAFARYAANLVKQSQAPTRRRRCLSLFGTDNGDHITQLTSQYLVPPLAKKMIDIKPPGWSIETVVPEAATKPKLRELLCQTDGPSLLFTAGHGAVSSKRTRALQGALICSEWQGGALPPDAFFCGADIQPEDDFRGLIPFFFACFSAGTPAFDSFAEPGKKPWQWHDHPFIGELPQALLGHPNGPTALIAHVDQAFQFSFLWNDDILGIAHFTGMYRRLMEGRRLGYAMAPFRSRFAAAMASLRRAKRMRKPVEDAEIKSWIGYQDARYYAVLGDPAARLPG